MNSFVLSLLLLAAGLLLCFGMLLGTTWTIQAMQPKLRHLAEDRRQLNEEWLALRAARSQLEPCPRCGYLVTEQTWYIAPTPGENPAEDE